MRAMAQLLLATATSGLRINPNGGLRTAGSPTLRAAAAADALLRDTDYYSVASAKEQAIIGRVRTRPAASAKSTISAPSISVAPSPRPVSRQSSRPAAIYRTRAATRSSRRPTGGAR